MLVAPAVGAPALASWPRRCWNTVLLMLWFAWQSARGGVDVALRALRRTPDIDPEVLVVPVELPQGHARQLAQLMMNLMPGTLIQAEKQLTTPTHTQHTDTTDSAAAAGAWPVVVLHSISADLDAAN